MTQSLYINNKDDCRPAPATTGMRPCKTAPRYESQNHATFTTNIESLLRKQVLSCFVPKYLGLPVLTKYFANAPVTSTLIAFRYYNFSWINITIPFAVFCLLHCHDHT